MTQALSFNTTTLRANQLFAESQERVCADTDRMFAWLMPIQWIAALICALCISPTAWSGAHQSVNPHVWAALWLGAMITVWPVLSAIYWPGVQLTRQVIAAAQMLMSALLIHLSGGRIETHFHVFGSLAFLAFYRDRRVLLTATVVVAADHFVRGVYFPISVFGTLTADPYRWLEHAGWVVFEDLFLFISIGQSLRQMRGLAERQASLEVTNARIEQTVADRTAELTREIGEREAAQARMAAMQKELLDASRVAGMAEVATNVLHNVGNVLNSVNVSHDIITQRLQKSEIKNVARVSKLLADNEGKLEGFLTGHASGKKLPGYIKMLSEALEKEQTDALDELKVLGTNIEHINEIVALQQNYAHARGYHETVEVEQVVETAIQVSGAGAKAYVIEFERQYGKTPAISIQKHKVIQVLVNLLSNAKHSLLECDPASRRITVRTGCAGDGKIFISIGDNGLGIPPENLTKIFAYGFTTKKDGHGFGLHGSSLAAKEMGGSVTVKSDGAGLGATFELELPMKAETVKKQAEPAALAA